MDTTQLLILLAAALTVTAFLLVYRKAAAVEKQSAALREALEEEVQSARRELQQFIQTSFNGLAEILASSQQRTAEVQDKRMGDLDQNLSRSNEVLQKTVTEMLRQINETMENRLTAMQRDNERKLEQMRETVDEKLQKTLEDRISQSFQLVSERLEQVYKGLGEMQTLAAGVGDLKKVLSNVKTRGILGEIQLGAILEQILSKEQYDENIATKPGSGERVEYAIRLPGDEGGQVFLPIDAKFPGDAYARLVEAYETGNPAEIETAFGILERTIKSFAKDIRDKYVAPPSTTDFGIMFLPFEGLYAEVVRRGLVETLQRDYKISIAGPTTMAALLNSLQMGFRTLAIQKHSGEVWNVLGAVKTEFDKFGSVLEATQQRISQANAELDKLVGVRTRKIQSKLRHVTAMPETASPVLLDLDLPEAAAAEGDD